MAGIEGKKFSRIIRRYRCDDEVQKQIREFIITTMIPDEDVVHHHCIVTVPDLSKRKLISHRLTRYYDVVFHVMYYQIGQTFVGEPVLEISYDAAEELTKERYDEMMNKQADAHTLLRGAEEIINPTFGYQEGGH